MVQTRSGETDLSIPAHHDLTGAAASVTAQVRRYDSFAALPASYRAVFEAGSTRHGFFLSWPWFNHLSSKGMDAKLQLHIYGMENNAIVPLAYAVLPMCYLPSANNSLQAKCLRALSNYYSSLFAPALSNDCPEFAISQLIAAIADDREAWDIVDLHPMSPDGSDFHQILQAFRQTNMAADSYYCFGNWYLPVLQRSYSQYFQELPSQLRHTIERKSRKLNKTGRLRLTIASAPADVHAATVDYLQVYESSWKNSEPFADFIPGWLATSAAEGWLRLGLAYIDGQPAAAQIWIVQHGTASIYKLAYDERYTHESVGSILTAHMMQHVIDVDHVHEVDYLTGDENYKQDWMSQRRERWGIIAFNLRTLKGLLAYGMHRTRRFAKQLRQQWKGQT